MRISRRTAITATAAALATAPALAATPHKILLEVGDDARLLELERRWRLLLAHANARGIPTEEVDRLTRLASRVSNEMLTIPANGPDGLMVRFRQLRYVSAEDMGLYDYEKERWQAFEADLTRIVGGAA